MVKLKWFDKTFIFVLLSIFSIGIISAALPPPSANFEIDFSRLNLTEGDWQLSVVSLPAYETDILKAKEVFDNIKLGYLDTKTLCGFPNYFELKLNPSQEEIEQLNKSYPFDSVQFLKLNGPLKEWDKLYTFYRDEKYTECTIPTGYGDYNDLNKVLENEYKKYKLTTNFWIYHYSKSVELQKNGEDIKAFYPTFCEIKEGKCNLGITETESTKGPYFVILEKMNSTKEIYFSGPVNINWESLEEVEWNEFDNLKNYSLDINQLNLPNLIVPTLITPAPEPEPSPSIYHWIIGLSILVILVISFLILKKKKN